MVQSTYLLAPTPYNVTEAVYLKKLVLVNGKLTFPRIAIDGPGAVG